MSPHRAAQKNNTTATDTPVALWSPQDWLNTSAAEHYRNACLHAHHAQNLFPRCTPHIPDLYTERYRHHLAFAQLHLQLAAQLTSTATGQLTAQHHHVDLTDPHLRLDTDYYAIYTDDTHPDVATAPNTQPEM